MNRSRIHAATVRAVADEPKPDWLFEQGFWAYCIARHSGMVKQACIRLWCKAYPATRTAKRPTSGQRNHTGAFAGYEAAKTALTARAKTPNEYATACRMAAKKARV